MFCWENLDPSIHVDDNWTKLSAQTRLQIKHTLMTLYCVLPHHKNSSETAQRTWQRSQGVHLVTKCYKTNLKWAGKYIKNWLTRCAGWKGLYCVSKMLINIKIKMQGSLLEHFNVKEDQYCYFNQSVVQILRPTSRVILSYPITLNQRWECNRWWHSRLKSHFGILFMCQIIFLWFSKRKIR